MPWGWTTAGRQHWPGRVVRYQFFSRSSRKVEAIACPNAATPVGKRSFPRFWRVSTYGKDPIGTRVPIHQPKLESAGMTAKSEWQK